MGQPTLRIDRHQVVHILGHIDHNRRIDRLTRQTTAATTGQHGQAKTSTHRHRSRNIIAVAGRNNCQRHDLIARRIGGELSACHRISANIATNLSTTGVHELIDERSTL